MHLGEFKCEREYLDPGLPLEQELVESAGAHSLGKASAGAENHAPQDDAVPVKV